MLDFFLTILKDCLIVLQMLVDGLSGIIKGMEQYKVISTSQATPPPSQLISTVHVHPHKHSYCTKNKSSDDHNQFHIAVLIERRRKYQV